MARFRVYIKSYDQDGNYLADFTEITQDVLKISNLAQSLDNSEFDLGIPRNSIVKLSLRNQYGVYSPPGVNRSMFLLKRQGSIVKITWDIRNYDMVPGFFYAGQEILGQEVEIYRGLLDDVTGVSNLETQAIDFNVLGFESLIDKLLVPFSSISAGDSASEIIYACLNQAPFNQLVTVNLSNIDPSVDSVTDTVASLENKTVKEALGGKNLLFVSNSILYIKDSVVYVKSRDATPSVQYNFYGQASINGLENIINILNYRDGLNRTFNFWTWKDTTLKAQDASSVDTYGFLKKEIESPLIDDASTSKINTILQSNRDEFSAPKTEFEIETPINYDTIPLFFKDRITVDYPNVYVPADENLLPRYGQNIYGGARYPFGQLSLVIPSSHNFKILSRKIDTTKHTITFGVRKI